MKNPFKKFFEPKLKLVRGTRFVSFLFVAFSVIIAAGFLFAANMYYNIDTGEVVMEEIYRVTGVIRATAGLIVGGTDSQNPSAGYDFEVIGPTKLATTTVAAGTLELTAANQVLTFSGGTGYYVGFKATTTLATTTVYTLPGAYPAATGRVLQSTNVGALSWLDLGAAGLGTITAIGDVTTGAAFTSGTASGTSLWFHDSGFKGELTIGTLSADRTYTLPNASGTLALGTGTASYAAYWSDTNTLAVEQYLSVIRGGTGAGTFTQYGILYGDGTNYLKTTATGTQYEILTSEGGTTAPIWRNISNLLTQGNNISLSGTTNVTIATVNNPTFSTSVTSPLFLSTTTLAIQSGDSQDITIDSASGRILLSSGDWIETAGGYQIGKAGTQILREMIPIFGFDLPTQTATTSYVQISRVLEDYPFPAVLGGTTRVHKLIFRYAASTTAPVDFRIYTNTEYSTSTLPVPASTDLAKGEAYIATTTIPIDTTAWRLDVKTATEPDVVRIFQIFLAAYDEID